MQVFLHCCHQWYALEFLRGFIGFIYRTTPLSFTQTSLFISKHDLPTVRWIFQWCKWENDWNYFFIINKTKNMNVMINKTARRLVLIRRKYREREKNAFKTTFLINVNSYIIKLYKWKDIFARHFAFLSEINNINVSISIIIEYYTIISVIIHKSWIFHRIEYFITQKR